MGEIARSNIDNGEAGRSGEACLKNRFAAKRGSGGERKGLIGDVGVVGEYGKQGQHGDTGEFDEYGELVDCSDADGSKRRGFVGGVILDFWREEALNCSGCDSQLDGVIRGTLSDTSGDDEPCINDDVVEDVADELIGNGRGFFGSQNDSEGVGGTSRFTNRGYVARRGVGGSRVRHGLAREVETESEFARGRSGVMISGT